MLRCCKPNLLINIKNSHYSYMKQISFNMLIILYINGLYCLKNSIVADTQKYEFNLKYIQKLREDLF